MKARIFDRLDYNLVSCESRSSHECMLLTIPLIAQRLLKIVIQMHTSLCLLKGEFKNHSGSLCILMTEFQEHPTGNL